MNRFHMKNSAAYSLKSLLFAAQYCYLNFMWVFMAVGGSAFFIVDGSLAFKVILCFGCSIGFCIPLYIANVVLHYRSLKGNTDIELFNGLTDKEKGKIIGEFFQP